MTTTMLAEPQVTDAQAVLFGVLVTHPKAIAAAPEPVHEKPRRFRHVSAVALAAREA